MRIEIEGWSSIDNCEYPICDVDEALPVYILWGGDEVEAWYSNPEMDVCWFESDTGEVFDGATTWKLRQAN